MSDIRVAELRKRKAIWMLACFSHLSKKKFMQLVCMCVCVTWQHLCQAHPWIHVLYCLQKAVFTNFKIRKPPRLLLHKNIVATFAMILNVNATVYIMFYYCIFTFNNPKFFQHIKGRTRMYVPKFKGVVHSCILCSILHSIDMYE